MFVHSDLQSTAIREGEAHDSSRRGREAGLKHGFEEGYLRGRAKAIVEAAPIHFPKRALKVLYVSSGKGFPYAPIDEAIIATLQTLAAEVSVAGPKQPVSELASSSLPDLMLVLDGMELPVEQVDAVRAKGIRTAIWLTDDPYYTDITIRTAPHYDYVFTLERNCLDFYRSAGCNNVHYLPFAAHVGHYRPTLTRSPVRRAISFIGSAYWNRIEFLQPIIGGLMEKGLTINGIWWDRLPEYASYPDRIEIGKWMGPGETAEVYSGSKIVLNMHRSPYDTTVNNNSVGLTAASPNPRTFEISACGTLQLADVRDDLASFYVPGQEIETFSNPSELYDKVNFYLDHETERREIALRALERTYREHTYSHRLHEMLSRIFS
ncbi:glycosyltransferase [Paenibacillus sp. FSL W8-0186]|uniref:Spore maturation protein n=1 Tax=Paenibacillus woosongensis TaxID=307580 RepID=A0ABQ4MMU5_9BACL|nr:glycosyltransferase [Paenibacillus woosongensis]GIP57304.1 spore maturation protein [Paenibacillus woosongensis]